MRRVFAASWLCGMTSRTHRRLTALAVVAATTTLLGLSTSTASADAPPDLLPALLTIHTIPRDSGPTANATDGNASDASGMTNVVGPASSSSS